MKLSYRADRSQGFLPSFVDTFKTELIKDRVWRSNSQLELAIVEYVAWFNTRRLHTSIGNRPPLEIEAEYHAAADAHSLLRSKVSVI